MAERMWGDLGRGGVAMMPQARSSRRCSETTNFSFLLGFIDGRGLNRNLKFAGATSIVK